MAENLKKLPKRGILKPSTSFEQRDLEPPAAHGSGGKNPHFDEQNLRETLHPADKDYGFMKIEEPKTPFEYASGVDEEDVEDGSEAAAADGGEPDAAKEAAKKDELDAQLLSERISAEIDKPRPRRFSEPSADEEDLKLLSPEERQRRKSFEQKRKMHYNEFQAVKLARQLMDEDDEDEGGDEGGGGGASSGAGEDKAKEEAGGEKEAASSSSSSSDVAMDVSTGP